MINISVELKKAREYEEKNLLKLITANRPVYHFSTSVGWMNDPNGFSLFQGEYHLFYQNHPYSIEWGPMHWGHAKTKDFVSWNRLPIALAPDQYYDNGGCFSGTAIEDKGKHIVAYTSVREKIDINGIMHLNQTQSIAVGDGLTYTKYAGNPVLTGENVPKGDSAEEFRDPKIWKEEDNYYLIAANKNKSGNGQILKYNSADLITWNEEGVLYQADESIGKMWECPDYFTLGRKKILIISPQDMEAKGLEFHCGNGSICLVGEEYKGGFIREAMYNLDYGIDFYAPQTVMAEDGRRVLIGWMQSWDVKSYPVGLDWKGMMTFPRELSLVNGEIRQWPVVEIKQYWDNVQSYHNQSISGTMMFPEINGRVIDMEIYIKELNCESFIVKMAKNDDHYISLSYEANTQRIIFDRKYSGCNRDIVNERTVEIGKGKKLQKLRILLDLFSVEIFINEGEKVLTSLFFINTSYCDIEFSTINGRAVIDLEKRDIVLHALR